MRVLRVLERGRAGQKMRNREEGFWGMADFGLKWRSVCDKFHNVK